MPTTETRRAPGPRGHWLMGCAHAFRADAVNFLTAVARDHGPVARFRLAHLTMHLVSSPEGARAVLQDRPHVYRRQSPGYRALRLSLGEGLLTADGPGWLRQRRLVQPAFAAERLEMLAPITLEATRRMLARWRSLEGPVDVAAELSVLTLEILGRALFGMDLSADAPAVSGALVPLLRFTIRRARSLVTPPLWVPLPSHREFHRELAQLDQVVYRMIRERRAGDRSGGDLLSTLIRATDEHTGEGMSDRQLRDEVLTLLLAGHETTANLLSWTMMLLMKHPEVEARLVAEVREVCGSEPPTFEKLPELRLMQRVLSEALRLYPPAWSMDREAIGDDTIGGHRIPAGSVVFFPPYFVHRHRDFWPDAESFDPERFNEETAGKRHKYAFVPFGGGNRLCVGRDLAMSSAGLSLAMLLPRVKLALEPGHPVAMHPAITLRPKHGLKVRATRRA